jgi:hypothetical protein
MKIQFLDQVPCTKLVATHFLHPQHSTLRLPPSIHNTPPLGCLRIQKKGEDGGGTHHVVLPKNILSPIASASLPGKKSSSSASSQEASEWCCSFPFLIGVWSCCYQGMPKWCHSQVPAPARGAPSAARS